MIRPFPLAALLVVLALGAAPHETGAQQDALPVRSGDTLRVRLDRAEVASVALREQPDDRLVGSVVHVDGDSLVLLTRRSLYWRLSAVPAGYQARLRFQGTAGDFLGESAPITVRGLERARGRKRIGGAWTGVLGAAVGAIVGAGVVYLGVTGSSGDEENVDFFGDPYWPITLVPGALVGGGIGVLLGRRTTEIWEPVPVAGVSRP